MILLSASYLVSQNTPFSCNDSETLYQPPFHTRISIPHRLVLKNTIRSPIVSKVSLINMSQFWLMQLFSLIHARNMSVWCTYINLLHGNDSCCMLNNISIIYDLDFIMRDWWTIGWELGWDPPAIWIRSRMCGLMGQNRFFQIWLDDWDGAFGSSVRGKY